MVIIVLYARLVKIYGSYCAAHQNWYHTDEEEALYEDIMDMFLENKTNKVSFIMLSNPFMNRYNMRGTRYLLTISEQLSLQICRKRIQLRGTHNHREM